MAQCPRCGTQVPASFCPSCGTQVVAPGQQGAAGTVPPPAPQGQQPPPAAPPSPYGAPNQPYGTPNQPYAPQNQPYGTPNQPYAPQNQPYAPPNQPYGAPNQPYGAPNQPYGAPNQPYGAPGYPPMQPAKRSSVGKVVLIILLVLAGLFALLLVIGSMLPDEPTNVSAGALGIVRGPVITDRVDPDTQEPIGGSKLTVPAQTETIYAALELNLKAGQEVTAWWYYEGVHQDHLDVTLPMDGDFAGWASFHIGNDGDPWPAGLYRVEAFVDGVKQSEVSFSVK